MKRTFHPVQFGGALLAALLLTACGGSRPFVPPPQVPDDRVPVPAPEYRSIDIPADVVEKQFFDQIEQMLDFSRGFRKLTGNPKEAYNVDAFDEVPNSSWYTNRHHRTRMSLDAIVRGPNEGQAGPNPDVNWTITKVKAEGVTPGFNIRDAEGGEYVIKFEPVGYAEMPSGAEVIGTKLFHAAGFNVPQNYVVYFRPDILEIEEGLTFVDDRGRDRLFNRDDLAALLRRVEPQPDGRIRVAASKLIKAKKFLGPFRYRSTRKDDPNDFIPHQHRRELRGLRVIAAWLNHYDTKDNNTLDIYSHDGYVKHYLIDFGSTLGSQGDEPMPPFVGNENAFDPHQVAINTVTLGLYVRPWERNWRIIHPSIGFFTSENFHPQKFKFILPNPAFEAMTDRDGFWGAKIVMSFRDEELAAIVGEARYSDPEATAYMVRTLQERRDIVGRYWFNRVNPLDRFVLDGGTVRFEDLAVSSGLMAAEGRRYRASINGAPATELQDLVIVLPADAPAPSTGQWEIAIETRRGDGHWMDPVRVYLDRDGSSGWRLIGVRR